MRALHNHSTETSPLAESNHALHQYEHHCGGDNDYHKPHNVEPSEASSATSSSRTHKSLKNCLGVWVEGVRSSTKLQHSNTKNWKPATLRTPVLGTFIFISISLIVVLEVLAKYANLTGDLFGSGALVYADIDGNIPSYIYFAYLYFPTIIAVVYSLLWSWIDLDAKRLEPWFQLSKQDGASAEDSLLLQYPFEFLAFVPITAGRRKHWSVFFAGTVMMIIFWGITPLQSAIFGTGTIARSQNLFMVTTNTLLPLPRQANALTASFLCNGYAISWLGQSLPPFTTSDHAIVPYAPGTSRDSHLSSELWTAEAMALSTDLTCSPAQVTPQKNLQYTFDDNKGCRVSDIGLPDAQSMNASYMMVYIGYYDNAVTDSALENENCTIENSHKFLAVWGSATSQTAVGMYGNMTALFCETSYYVQNLTVQVNATDHSVMSLKNTLNFTGSDNSTREHLSEDTFNITHFEYFIGTGVSDITQELNYPETAVLEQYPRLIQYNITWPTTNLVGFAVAANNGSVDILSNPANLEGAFRKAHQLLFSVAANSLMNVTSPDPNIRNGTLSDVPEAIIMVRIFSIIVEAFLGVTILMACGLLYVSHRRSSLLTRDPASIGTIMSLVSTSQFKDDIFKDTASMSVEELNNHFGTRRFKLQTSLSEEASTSLASTSEAGLLSSTYSGESQTNRISKMFKTYSPFEMRMYVGAFFIGVITCSIGALVYINIIISKHNGLELPTSNAVIRQILENYVPTILATLLEPFWVVLNRLLCILRPFETLRKGHAMSSKSIDIQYNSRPPQLVMWQAIKAHHFLLAAVCVIALLANVLAVSLSGLFNESSATKSVVAASPYKLSSTFNGSAITDFVASITYSDHFYVSLANLSSGLNLPPWIGQEFMFMPFEIPTSNDSQTIQYTASTRGWGADMNCNLMQKSGSNDTINFLIEEHDVQFSTNHYTSDGQNITCVASGEVNGKNQTTLLEMPLDDSAYALEIMSAMATIVNDSLPQQEPQGVCESLIVAGWIHMPNSTGSPPNNANVSIQDRSTSSMFLSCQPTLRTALFEVTTDRMGNVLSSSQSTPFDSSLGSFFAGNASYSPAVQGKFIDNATTALLSQANNLITPTLQSGLWHTAPFTGDWMNSLLRIALNSSDLVDANKPIPDASTVAPAVEKIYKQLFATLLGLNMHVFAPTDFQSNNSQVMVTMNSPETRIFMSQPMFIVTLIILSLNLVVAIAYYIRRPPAFLPAMPTTIAVVIGFVAGSRAVREWRDERDQKSEDVRYGYGRFIDVDGVARIGIEKWPYVVPLEARNPNVRRRKWYTRTWRKEEKEVKTWI